MVTVSGRITNVTVINSNSTTYPVVTLPFAMTANSTAVCGPVLMLVGSTWTSGAIVDCSRDSDIEAMYVYSIILVYIKV
jgi:hypothetical protein